ncbi:hypothetical protein SEA_CASSITA_51 [Microbacterium phage Cassita]|nr:hypothetical protein SEA_CASSITA_51 [Microbacterium phage Cassita]
MTDGDDEIWYEIYTPWWTRFGRIGDDGLTRLERNYIAREFMRKTSRKGFKK